MLLSHPRRAKGFTLIELLIVIAIVGIIAAILIPNLLDSLQKSRQKRTMTNMREIGNGLAQYWSDSNGAAAAGAVTIDISDWTGTATLSEIDDVLVPDYMPSFPPEDGWGVFFDLRIQLSSPPRSGYAMARSPGRGGAFDSTTYVSGSFLPTLYDQDIVWADGSFVRGPASVAGT